MSLKENPVFRQINLSIHLKYTDFFNDPVTPSRKISNSDPGSFSNLYHSLARLRTWFSFNIESFQCNDKHQSSQRREAI